MGSYAAVFGGEDSTEENGEEGLGDLLAGRLADVELDSDEATVRGEN